MLPGSTNQQIHPFLQATQCCCHRRTPCGSHSRGQIRGEELEDLWPANMNVFAGLSFQKTFNRAFHGDSSVAAAATRDLLGFRLPAHESSEKRTAGRSRRGSAPVLFFPRFFVQSVQCQGALFGNGSNTRTPVNVTSQTSETHSSTARPCSPWTPFTVTTRPQPVLAVLPSVHLTVARLSSSPLPTVDDHPRTPHWQEAGGGFVRGW